MSLPRVSYVAGRLDRASRRGLNVRHTDPTPHRIRRAELEAEMRSGLPEGEQTRLLEDPRTCVARLGR